MAAVELSDEARGLWGELKEAWSEARRTLTEENLMTLLAMASLAAARP